MADNTQPPPGSRKVEIPPQSTPQKAVAPVAAVSSRVDPMPDYIMSAACAGGAGWAYKKMNNPRAAVVAGGFSFAYLFAGRLLAQGHQRLGYDVGTLTSIGLLGLTGPTAWATGEAYSTALATASGMSSVANLIKSYQIRTGLPAEPQITERRGSERAVQSH